MGVVLIVHALDFLDGARRIVEIMIEQRSREQPHVITQTVGGPLITDSRFEPVASGDSLSDCIVIRVFLGGPDLRQKDCEQQTDDFTNNHGFIILKWIYRRQKQFPNNRCYGKSAFPQTTHL